MTGASRLEVNSGTICASVVSILSILSTRIFLNVPEDVSFTYPSGTRASFSQQDFLIFASTVNVALCESAVEIECNNSARINDNAIHTALTRYALNSMLLSRNIFTTSAITKYGITLKITLPVASTTLHT